MRGHNFGPKQSDYNGSNFSSCFFCTFLQTVIAIYISEKYIYSDFRAADYKENMFPLK